MWCDVMCSDVDVSTKKVYFASKTDTVSKLRSLTLGDDADEIFDSNIEKQIDDEIINGLSSFFYLESSKSA